MKTDKANSPKSRWIVMCVAAMGTACAAESAAIVANEPNTNVVQGGQQDIAEFRRLVGAGKIPGHEVLDQVGFFAEHAVDFPEPDCDGSVCAQASLAVAPRFDKGNWTTAFIGLNTALSLADLPQQNRHFIVVAESSIRAPLPEGLADQLAAAISPNDRVSIVEFDSVGLKVRPRLTRELLQQGESIGTVGVYDSSQVLSIEGESVYGSALDAAPDVYAALFEAMLLAESDTNGEFANRMLVFTSGRGGTGIASTEALRELGADLARADISVSTFGVGPDFVRELPVALTSGNQGRLSVGSSTTDLSSAVAAEIVTGFWPLARNLRLQVLPEAGYVAAEAYGSESIEFSASAVVLNAPVLFLGARSGSGDSGSGRRGGGGGWFVRFQADSAPGESSSEDALVATILAEYDDALTGEHVSQTIELKSPLGRGNNPEPNAPYFSDPARAKTFMMLNMYLALDGAVRYYEEGDCARAYGMHEMMYLSYQLWNDVYQDADIDADATLLAELGGNIKDHCSATQALWPVSVHASCFFM